MLSELKEGLDDESWDIDEIKLANLKPSFKQFNNDPSDTELDFNDADFSFASLDTAFSVSNTLTNLPPSTFTHFKSYCTKEKCHDTFTLSPRSTPFPSFSPSISIACSLVVSESEDENYDDLEFPETLSKQSIEQTDTLGLVIPLNFTGQISSKSKLKHTSNYLKPTASTLSKVKKVVLKCAKNAPVFGDGSELEMMDELIVKPGSELRYSKIAKNAATKINEKGFSRSEDVLAKRISLSRSLVNTSRAKSSDISRFGVKHDTRNTLSTPIKKEKAPKKKPTLIRSLNVPKVQVLGDMVYNPILHSWEGNDACLLDFDRHLSKTHRPALIQNTTLPHTVGNMVFDPFKMCWVGNAEEEEEDDIFKDIQGDFTDTKNTLTLTEFTLSNKLKELFSIAESNHKLFIGKWFIRANSRNIVRDSSRAYLYDIRD